MFNQLFSFKYQRVLPMNWCCVCVGCVALTFDVCFVAFVVCLFALIIIHFIDPVIFSCCSYIFSFLFCYECMFCALIHLFMFAELSC